jgi:hypothetical protein
MSNPGGTPENLSKPGMTNNPNGRPKGTGLRQILRKIMEEEDKETGKTKGERIMEVLEEKAKKGNIRAVEMVIENVDGKLPQAINVDPLNINFTFTTREENE